MRQIERQAGQISRQNLRQVGGRKRVGLRLVPQPIAHARLGAAGAATALIGRRARDPHGFKSRQPHVRLVARHPREPAVDHDAHALDGERGLRDRGRQHDLAASGQRGRNGAVLYVGFKRAEERHHVGRRIADALAQKHLGAADFAGTRQKRQHRALVRPQCLHHSIGDRALDRHAQIAAAIAGLDRISAAMTLDHRRITQQRRHPGAVDGRRHDQQPQILAQPGLHIARKRQAEVGIERALVELVEQQRRYPFERRILQHHTGEHALGDHLDAGSLRHLGAEAHAIAHGVADCVPERRSHAGRSRARGKPARLEHDDLLVRHPQLAREHERHARGLAGARRGHQHRDVARAKRGYELRQRGIDR